MAVSVDKIFACLNALAPVETAEPWDNVGILVRGCEETDGVLCALDITPETVAEAAAKNCGVIVSHHPVIFRPFKTLGANDVPALLIKADMTAICMHTNLDKAAGGVNDTLARRLQLVDAVPFADGVGRLGMFAGAWETPAALAAYVRERLGGPVQYVPSNKMIRRAAVVSGSGGDYVDEAARAGADCLITGEASHHDALDAKAAGIALIVATHFSTEREIASVLAQTLRSAFPALPVHVSDADLSPLMNL